MDQSNSSPSSGPTTPTRSSLVRLKKASSVGAVCGNDSSFTNKDDLSTTDGINPKHKQEQCQSSKDAGPARRGGQPTSQRRVRDSTDQHGRGGGAPRHQPTLAEIVGTTHQANTTPLGDTTYPKRPKPCYPRRETPRPSSRSG